MGHGTALAHNPDRQPRETELSIINEKTVADFTRVVEQTGILEREPSPHGPARVEER